MRAALLFYSLYFFFTSFLEKNLIYFWQVVFQPFSRSIVKICSLLASALVEAALLCLMAYNYCFYASLCAFGEEFFHAEHQLCFVDSRPVNQCLYLLPFDIAVWLLPYCVADGFLVFYVVGFYEFLLYCYCVDESIIADNCVVEVDANDHTHFCLGLFISI